MNIGVGESIKRMNLLLVDERLYDEGNCAVGVEIARHQHENIMDICNRNPSAVKSCVITCALDCLHLKLLITVGLHTRTFAVIDKKKFPMFTLHFRLIRNASV